MRTAVLAIALGGCSLGVYKNEPCTTNQECRDTFGWGQVCNQESGLCEAAEAFARCDSSYPADLLTDREKYADALVFGAIIDRSYAPAEMYAFELPFTQLPEAGGPGGTTVALIECDSQESASIDDLSYSDATVAAATWLADDIGVAGILGPDSSSTTEASYYAVEPLGTLLLSHSATSDSLTDLDGATHSDDDPGLLWRTCPPDSLQGAVLAYDLMQQGIQKLSIIYEAGLYGEGLATRVQADFAVDGSHTVVLYQYNDATQRDEAVVSAGNSSADAVLFISSVGDDIEAFLNGAGTLTTYDDKQIYLTDAAYYTDIFNNTADLAGDLFDQVRGTRPTVDTTSAEYQSFAVSYSATYGLDAAESSFTAHAYDAAWLMLYGAAWSQAQEGGVTGEGIARGLRRVSVGDDVAIQSSSWSSVVASFEAGASVDVTGASGTLDYDTEDWEVSAPITVWTVVSDGEGVWKLEEDYTREP